MGHKVSKVPASPLALYQKCHQLHMESSVKEMEGVLLATAEKMNNGGLLLWQIVGRIEGEVVEGKRPTEPDLAAMTDGYGEGAGSPQGGSRLALTRLDSSLADAQTPKKKTAFTLPPAEDELADYPGFSIPTSLASLGDIAAHCTHTSCKTALITICKTVWTASGQSQQQRLNNMKSMAELACKLVLSALRRRLSMEELGSVCDTVRFYSRVRLFRRKFFSGSGHVALVSHFTYHRSHTPFQAAGLVYHVCPEAMVPALGGLRLLLDQEYDTDSLEEFSRVVADCSMCDVLCNIISNPTVDCTVLIEACATANLIMKALGPTKGLVPIAASALELLGGVEDWELNEAAVKYVLETLSFLVHLYKDLCSFEAIPVVRVCRRVIIKHGLLSAILYHAVLVLDKAITSFTAEDRSSQAYDDDVLVCYDALGSALSRLVASVDHGTDMLADIMGKVCALISGFTQHARHKALLLTHACCHLMGKHVLRRVDLPDFILVPCIETVGSVVGSEASALALQKTLDTVAEFKVQDTPTLLCRLLSEAKHNPVPYLRTAKSVFGTLLRLVGQKSNAQQVFGCMTVAELWMWRNLRVHLLKDAEREVNRNYLKSGDFSVTKVELRRAAVLYVQEQLDKVSVTARRRAAVVAGKWERLPVSPPPGVEWEVDKLVAKVPLAETIEVVSNLATMLNEALLGVDEIREYCTKYEDYAAKLQKWYRKKLAVARIARACTKKTKQHKAAVSIQKRWRGAAARKQHTTRLRWETTKREAAELIQEKWRVYLAGRSVEGIIMMEYICKRLRIVPCMDVIPVEKAQPGTLVFNHVVDITEATFDSLLMEKPVSGLVFFYSPWCSRCAAAHKTYNDIAHTFSDDSDVVIGQVNVEDNKGLVTRLKVPCYPYLLWVDAESVIHPYTASWPKKPMTISELIETFMALEIQRIWRGRQVKLKYKNMMETIRHDMKARRMRSMRAVCETGNEAKLLELLDVERVCPDNVTDTGELPLNIALNRGYKHLFLLLLKFKADINAVDERGHSPVFYAVSLGQCDILQMLAKHGASLTTQDKLCRTLLHVACESGHETMASLLLHMGLDKFVDYRDVSNYTALDYAMVGGLESIAMKLLMRGVAMHKDIEERLIYHSQIRSMVNISKLIIQQGLSDLERDDGTDYKWTPLHYAAAAGKPDVVSGLIDAGVNLEPFTAKRETPLHLAAKKGNYEVADILFDAMGVPAAMLLELHEVIHLNDDVVELSELGPYIDSGGNTVLHYACNQAPMSGFAEKLLNMVQDESIPLKNLSGNTPLHFAASKGIYFAAFKLASRLVVYGHCDIVNNNGNTALHLAVINGHKEVTTLLLDTGCDLNITDYEGNSLLHIACASKRVDATCKHNLVKLLLGYDHPVAVRNGLGQTPLHLAAAAGHFFIVQELVLQEDSEHDARANYVNQQDRVGNTALHYACQRGKKELTSDCTNYPYNNQMIVFLIVEGGDASVENGDFITPRELVVNENVINRANVLRAERVEEETIMKLLN